MCVAAGPVARGRVLLLLLGTSPPPCARLCSASGMSLPRLAIVPGFFLAVTASYFGMQTLFPGARQASRAPQGVCAGLQETREHSSTGNERNLVTR